VNLEQQAVSVLLSENCRKFLLHMRLPVHSARDNVSRCLGAENWLVSTVCGAARDDDDIVQDLAELVPAPRNSSLPIASIATETSRRLLPAFNRNDG